MKRLDKLEPMSLVHGRSRTIYYPLGNSSTAERAYEESRLFRRLGYKAQVWVYLNPHVNEDRYIVMVGEQYLYNSQGK